MAERSTTTTPDDDDALGRLLRLAGRPDAIDPARVRRVHAATRAAWRDAARARARTRRLRVVIVAAAACAAALVAAVAAPRLDGGPVALVEVAAGARVGDRALVAGEAVPGGAEIRCGDGRVSLRLPRGHSLRLDRHAIARVRRDAVELIAGEAYVDHDGPESGGAALTIATRFGAVRERGTRFAVAVEDGALRVRVRDGAVRVETTAHALDAAAGEDVAIDLAGHATRATVRADDACWRWSAACAPAPQLDGATLGQALAWICREYGWSVAWADPARRARDEAIRLHGVPDGLAPLDALDVVLPVCGLDRRLEDGHLLILSPETPR